MKVILDNREPQTLKTLIMDKIPSMELRNLEIGDIIILDENDNVKLIFERKCIPDLLSSIKDGRYKDQSFRLKEYPLHNHNIYYIIEGSIINLVNGKNNYNEISQKSLYSAMFSLSYTKGFSLLHTSGIIETAEFIIHYYEKLVKDKSIKPYYNFNENIIINNEENNEKYETKDQATDEEKNNKKYNEKDEYSLQIKTSKKSFITKENINEIMLSQIPNISIHIAKSIMNKFNSLENLISKLKEDKNCLDNIKIITKNSERKISKNAIQNIINYLL